MLCVFAEAIAPAQAYVQYATSASCMVYEAEDALLENVAVTQSIHAVDEPVAYSGEGMVGDFSSTDGRPSALTFEVTVPEDGTYDLVFYAFSPFSYKNSHVLIDGEWKSSMPAIPQGKSFQAVRISADLARGAHLIRMEEAEGFFYVDALTVTRRERIAIAQVTSPPVNPDASKETLALKTYLNESYGKVVLSGQHADGVNSPEIKAIHAETGKHPAIMEFDFLYTGKTASENAEVNYSTTQEAIDWWKNGGIVAFCWHWLAPRDHLPKFGPWNKAFETRCTAFNLRDALSGKDPEAYALLTEDIDAVAKELKALQRAKVPVLWRPIHEGSSGFFWWGAAGAEAYSELWRLMYDRLVNVHGLDNLLWVWSADVAAAESTAWYPGDDVIDIVGLDIYTSKTDYTHLADRFLAVQAAISADKIITLSETGIVPDINQLNHYGNLWAWFSPWNREYIVDMKAGYEKGIYSEAYTDRDTLRETYGHELVITREELPSFRGSTSRVWIYVAVYSCLFVLLFRRRIFRFLSAGRKRRRP